MSTRRSVARSSTAWRSPSSRRGHRWLATTAWRGFTETPGSFLSPLLLLAALVAGSAPDCATCGWPGSLVLLVQLVVGGIAATSIVAGTLVVTGEGWLRLGERSPAPSRPPSSYQAPVPADVPGIEPLLILGGWFCLRADRPLRRAGCGACRWPGSRC